MMMKLGKLPIKTKLIAMMTITASIGILSMAIVITVNEAITKRDAIVDELATLAELIGSRSTGSLTFNDPKTAKENLNALSIKENIIYAAIFQAEDLLFAEYQPPSESKFVQRHGHYWFIRFLQQMWSGNFTDTIEVSRDIFLEGQRIGKVLLRSSMNTFYVKLISYLYWVGITMMVCFSLSLVVSARLHKLISSPVLELHKVTNTVSKNNDYTIRIPTKSEDELGSLISGFNTMLEQIEIRDHKLARYRDQLEALVDERTGELVQANERRIQWLENMARFLKHELKNSTVGVRSSLELIERRSQDPSIEVYLGRAKKSLNYMNVLLVSVSNASSLEAMIFKESLNPVNLGLIVQSQVNEYRLSFPQYEIIENIDQNINILGNEDRLRQLLDNLFNNAFEHSRLSAPILVNAKNTSNFAELSVINEGVKLPENKEQIFDLFVSLRDAEHWKSDNLGLGLYLVKLITESHGGSVQAINRQDKDGAVFTIKIPLIEA